MSFSAESLLAARTSLGTLVGDLGLLLDPDGYVVESGTTSTSWGSLAADGAPGVVGVAQIFEAVAPTQTTQLAGQIILRIPWTLTTQSAGAATRGQLVVNLVVNGVTVASGLGAIRNLNDPNGTLYTEIVALIMSTAIILPPGSTVRVSIQESITTSGAAGNTFTGTLRHDPQEPTDQLAVEFQGLAGVN